MRIKTYVDLADEFDICDIDIQEISISPLEIERAIRIAAELRTDSKHFAHASSDSIDLTAKFISSEDEEIMPEYFPHIKVYRNYFVIVWPLDGDGRAKLVTKNITTQGLKLYECDDCRFVGELSEMHSRWHGGVDCPKCYGEVSLKKG